MKDQTIYKITLVWRGVFTEKNLYYEIEKDALYACRIYSILCDVNVTIPEKLTIPKECAEELLKIHSIF